MTQARPRIVAIVQARMTSTRLPGKVLADLAGRPVLRFMLDRLRRASSLDAIVVATTVNAADDPVVEVARKAGAEVFRGEEKDVLSRFVGAGEAARAEVVVRLTADCPLIDPAVVDHAVALFFHAGADYAANVVERTYPDGLDVEVTSLRALTAACREASDPYEREHVTPFIYRRAGTGRDGTFRVAHLRHEADFSHLRWTIDTQEDLDRVRALLRRAPPDCSWQQALAAATWAPELMGIAPSAGAARP